MDFGKMMYGCPWMSSDNTYCTATHKSCTEVNCAMYHWACELANIVIEAKMER